jgi:Uma2 family endonuclease
MAKTAVIIGPKDHERRMSLEDFDQADIVDGYLYELARGTIIVSAIPDDKHFAQVDAIKQQLYSYRATHKERIHRIGGGAECKILLTALESERHPDIAVYQDERPDGDDYWSFWVPEIVIEVVSASSAKRDYEEKPEEYLAFGVREYWIVDNEKSQMTVLRRSGGRWSPRTVKEHERYKTRLLPGFELDLAAVFAAARDAAD